MYKSVYLGLQLIVHVWRRYTPITGVSTLKK
jgi:hypothetical protein